MKRFGIRKYIVFIVDFLITAFSFAFCYVMDRGIITKGFPSFTESKFLIQLALVLVITSVFRLALFGYGRVWRFAVAKDYIRFVIVDAIAFTVYLLVQRYLPLLGKDFFVNSYRLRVIFGIAVFAITDVLVLTSRFVYICLRGINSLARSNNEKKRALIVGAGEAGVLLLNELLGEKSVYEPVAFIDIDSEKIGKLIRGIKVYDQNTDPGKLKETVKFETVIIAIPSLSLERRKEIVKSFTDCGCEVRIYDYQMRGSAEKTSLGMREVRIEDLLGRDTIHLDMAPVAATFKDKVVLVTGAGGSIGSELCRQVARMEPKRLVMLDVYENCIYDIQQELRRNHGGSLTMSVEICSVCDKVAVEKVFEKYKPEYVIHAAAHKHVPLMEDCCREAVLNNVFGTYNVANAAEKYGVKKMLLISTDKAVNPTNVMGATKRLCEMIILSKSNSTTDYVAVRFGNVLGSNGSVIPLFKRQIAEGGPVTLTDKRIVRYFMTIPEAVSLVLETETMAADCEIFVLDMGEPVKILDLAESLISLSGYKPYEDIDIIEVGLRPGEKLYEELLIKTEGLVKTANSKIFIDHDVKLTKEELDAKLEKLLKACDTCDNEEIRKAIASVVPTYTPTDNAESRRNASHLSVSAMAKS